LAKRGELLEKAIADKKVYVQMGIATGYVLRSGGLLGLEGEEEIVEAWLKKNKKEIWYEHV
jgi:hypothetical protein